MASGRVPGGAELRRQAMDLEWDIAEMVPSTIEGYHAKREAIVRFEFDEENICSSLYFSLATTRAASGSTARCRTFVHRADRDDITQGPAARALFLRPAPEEILHARITSA
jgi:hypothetical protein